MPDAETEYYREIIIELCQLKDGLTGWEVEFVDQMANWKRPFTVVQKHKLDQIYAERT